MNRQWFMVQFRLNADRPMEFRFAETREEAEQAVKGLQKAGYYATCWEL